MTDLNTNMNGAKVTIGLAIKDKELADSIKAIFAQVQTVLQWIKSALNANTVDGDKQAVDTEGKPVVDEENNPVMEKVLDLDRVVNSILDGATGAFGGLVDIPDMSTFVQVTTEGTENTAMIKLSSVNDLVASIAAESCDSNADVFNIVFNYVYDNLFGETNYNTLMTALDLLPSLVPSIPADTIAMIKGMIPELKGENALDMLDTLMVMTGVLEEEADPTPDPVPADPDNGNSNPATGDAAFAVVAGASVLAAGAVVILARKSKKNGFSK